MPASARLRSRRTWVSAALVAITAPVLVLGGSSHAYAITDQQKLSQLQQDAGSAATDIGVRDAAAERAALALLQLNAKVTTARNALAGANRDLAKAQKILADKRGELAQAQSDERAAQVQVTAATAKYDHARDQLEVMLRSAFENGVGGDLDALMDGGTPDQLADRIGLLDQVSATRQHRLKGLAASKNELTRRENVLAAARKRAQNAVTAADQDFDTVSADQSRAQDAAAQLVSLQRQQQSAFSKAKTAAAAAQKKYADLQASSARLQEVLAARAAGETGTLPLSTGDPGAESAGGLVMPTTGVFSSGFGYRTDPFGNGTTFHAGQDIAAPTGTPIVAATAGTVAIVETPDQSGGYGNYTCIDRGAGFATCYGHQSAILVHVGEVVKQGQLIGLVGSTGASTGPHLHFEVRINGVPVDPLPYLP
ncbi:MAG TPA: peptidoglycan DD-metalloendopeptidase family protein [Frankiaceae bacterium]|jgi:murein DD-endopeptidase MepM/ murein hydrolase activator NlpD|nr:peptidoglycan DD-metalloendopeptidase family protein [Frankiaceae bacterium]